MSAPTSALLASLFLLACSGRAADTPAESGEGSAEGGSDGGSESEGEGGAGEGGGSGDPSDWEDLDLYGDQAAERTPAPEFSATNSDGAARDREDLLGHPTVMWFYPAAATAG